MTPFVNKQNVEALIFDFCKDYFHARHGTRAWSHQDVYRFISECIRAYNGKRGGSYYIDTNYFNIEELTYKLYERHITDYYNNWIKSKITG